MTLRTTRATVLEELVVHIAQSEHGSGMTSRYIDDSTFLSILVNIMIVNDRLAGSLSIGSMIRKIPVTRNAIRLVGLCAG